MAGEMRLDCEARVELKQLRSKQPDPLASSELSLNYWQTVTLPKKNQFTQLRTSLQRILSKTSKRFDADGKDAVLGVRALQMTTCNTII